MRRSISLPLLLVAFWCLQVADANPNNWYYATSAESCGGQQCSEANGWRFYTCYEQKCEHHLQPWFPALVLVVACAIISSVVSCLIRCLCCCCCHERNPRTARYYA
ncbi:hypothetical protein QR680_010952 [Steinernema hermaphroditum]|uniref:Uncharacterized protein n=1 Tax=Steinernema hermaphroditum TaxID=289476 RepID=A0AA39IT46_9BILA|nr:hypothetical protein QR680_010952 [Steinernema hermaphroditum]